MKFTLNWLKDHLETECSLSEICDGLVRLGHEVEEVVDPAQSLSDFRIVEIKEAQPHPEADRLQLCVVDDNGSILQIVCGAPNARAGLKTVLAPIGTYVPAIDIIIKKGLIRGQESNGMLCAFSELGLNGDRDGIIELPDDAPLGTSYIEYADLNDPVIEIAITPNRGDCLGVRGIARDLSAASIGRMKPLDTSECKGEFDSPIHWALSPDAVEIVPRVTGRYFQDVANKSSPEWMARRLISIGQRPISALVDITNYIMIDLGRPLHAFDADKIRGDTLFIRRANAGEKILALNEKEYECTPDMLVIGDRDGADDIAGIMGGERTGITDDTQNLFLEIAIFDPISVAATGRTLNINSDARYRFERGLDGESPDLLSGYIARFVQSICGGKISREVSVGAGVAWQRCVYFNPELTQQLTGIELAHPQQRQILNELGFIIEPGEDKTWNVTPPAWRNDIDGQADLVEEIIRVAGYDKLPMVPLPRLSVVAQPAYSQEQLRPIHLRRMLVAAGLNEAVTFSFMAQSDAALFGGGDDALTLVNPISSELDCMRPSILPNLLNALSRNMNRGIKNVRLFEIGPVFHGTDEASQTLSCAGVLNGDYQIGDWQDKARCVDVFDAKKIMEKIGETLGVSSQSIQLNTPGPAWFHPGQSANMMLGKTAIGSFGMIHPEILAAFDIKVPVAAFDCNINAIPLPRRKNVARPLLKLSAFQPVERDFAFVLDEEVSAAKLLRAVRAAAKDKISDIGIFDVYEGAEIGDGKKSIAVKIQLTPDEATFTEAELQQISADIVASVEKQCAGKLRG